MTQLACIFHFFPKLVLALQPFATPSSVSLLIRLQTVLLRTPMLSVELRILSFFKMPCLILPLYMFPNFFKAMPFLHFMPFFQTFFLRVFLRFFFKKCPSCNFLISPTVASIFLGFSKLAVHFFLHFRFFFQHVPLLSCNPLPLLSRHHSSSPCKQSCSEPQRTLLSVELQIVLLQTPTDAALR